MATVDANYKFTSIDVGSYGRLNDSTIFRSSVLGDALHCKTLPIPPHAECSGFTDLLPYIFLGDEAFPLMKNLMRPYPICKVTGNMDCKVFNYRLSRARQTVECAFKITASIFRVFRKQFEIKLETIDSTVKAGCVLHNYSRVHTTSCEACDDNTEEMPADQLLPLSSQTVRPTTNAFHARENFTRYFNTSGALPWQRFQKADCVQETMYNAYGVQTRAGMNLRCAPMCDFQPTHTVCIFLHYAALRRTTQLRPNVRAAGLRQALLLVHLIKLCWNRGDSLNYSRRRGITRTLPPPPPPPSHFVRRNGWRGRGQKRNASIIDVFGCDRTINARSERQ
ncbi:hypothetical protein PR048_031447 [Dryococelus australis]|uniref:DDE Tnp4 domain-containing protein n=1 Tax=Dryococelus australis TaxID=614101 RepID=A0ABQ9G9C4_9NEOP|nr:hypothetical protein PR048_031447 [Dryococelus australis]